MKAQPNGSPQPTSRNRDRTLPRAVRPFVRFFQVEAAGAIVLVVATVVALIWANSPWSASYDGLWATVVRVEVGSYVFAEDLGHVVNDVLMAGFFFVVGMEIKRELVTGELCDRRSVALPAVAAVGGMLVPAGIYVAFNAGGAGAHGWGIPMATDIAFALGVVALLGRRVPTGVRVLLLTLAIVDDIGAIVVIAAFYTERVEPSFVLGALAVAALVAVMHRFRVGSAPVFAFVGLLLWLAVYESGIHATIAGVVMGLLTPARPVPSRTEAGQVVDDVGAISPCDRLIDALHPWTSYVIVPIFALANAGISLTAESITSPSAVTAGTAVALVAGKFIGVASFGWLTVQLRLGRLPAGARWGHVCGVAALAGIGFTVSLFVTGLAFDDAAMRSDAKTGILMASIVAALVGSAILAAVARRDHR